uniref:G protein signaling modulator 1 n=1 Tax=Paramormyrops kingsleyae TaxID=1676925 RepID=A0A3B3RT93_9TELE
MSAGGPPAAQEVEASCLDLALEGERLCKVGNFKEGAAYFEAAVQVGTEDLKTLSAIYSQLGNAYFYLKEYGKALEFHRHDLTLARTIGDRIGEGKASGNLGNTLKVLARYDEAVVCCQRHLDISREQEDKVGEARALYNIGNVFHAKGKQQSWGCNQDPGNLPPEVRETLEKATVFYEMNLSLVKELGDRAAQGRAYGNLGNTHYLLGNFVEAIKFHRERLSIAKEFGDKAAERRAYSNLGNALIFLGEFDTATEYYRKTLQLSYQLKDQVMEAQACYSLGNTYTLLQQYERAADYHLKHLTIAQQLTDRVGEGRACWSLGNAYVALGNHRRALHYARKHLEISREVRAVGQDIGQLAEVRCYDCDKRLRILRTNFGACVALPQGQNGSSQDLDDVSRRSRNRMSRPPRRKGTDGQPLDDPPWPDSRGPDDSLIHRDALFQKLGRDPSDEDCFFDLLSKFQSSRMDDQRCRLDEQQNGAKGMPPYACSLMTSPQTEELFDLIASSQSRRLDDQRVSVSNLPGLRITHNNLGHLCVDGDPQEPGDDFFNMLIKCQSSRINDQRCSPPDPGPRAPTVPDEDFFSLIQRVQAKRMDEQRVHLPSDEQDGPDSEHGEGIAVSGDSS